MKKRVADITKRITSIVLSVALIIPMLADIPFTQLVVSAASVSLSADEQWITGLTTDYEYITEHAYNTYGGETANNKYWTSLSSSGGKRADGTPYAAGSLVDGNKFQVASAWYGQTVYFRERGTSGTGTAIEIPDYSDLKESYKKAIRILNVRSSDFNTSYYGRYISAISDSKGYLKNTNGEYHLDFNDIVIETFNVQAQNILTDAEGNYLYDLVVVGPYTYTLPDISDKAAWVLKDYINEGYGFLIGHDTLYGDPGVTHSAYVPSKDATTTKYYNEHKENHHGHWNMNWLVGTNKKYTEARPYETASLILSLSDHTDKSTIYGNSVGNYSYLNIASKTEGDPLTDLSVRCPTNFPYNDINTAFTGGFTHSNMQLAYGKVWVDFMDANIFGRKVTDHNEGLSGTNNFYLTTNGNIGMIQAGHLGSSGTATTSEAKLLANTIMYLSQRETCLICQSQQGGHDKVHNVIRISSMEELWLIGEPGYELTYPLDACYVLTSDIEFPDDWEPIENFSGHFNANNFDVINHGMPMFANGSKVLTVTYNANGGKFGSSDINKVVYLNNEISDGKYLEPTKEESEFLGWYTDKECTDGNEFELSKATSNITVYAKWDTDQFTYNIEYVSKSGVELGTADITNEYGKTAIVNPKAFPGYTSPDSQEVRWDSTKAKTITFIYEPIEYTITYELNGGKVNENNRPTYTIETQTFTLNNPEKSGYRFMGWTGSNGDTPEEKITISKGTIGDKNYTATWKGIVSYKVQHWQLNVDGNDASYDDKNYTLKETETLEGISNEKVTPEVKNYTGFVSPDKQTVTVNADGTTVVNYYYARTKHYLDLSGVLDGTNDDNITKYGTVDVYVNGKKVATGVSDYYAQHNYGSTYEIKNTTALAGRKYEGVAEGSLTGTILSNRNVRLRFSTITYTISYVLNGGNVSGNPATYTVDSEDITLINPTKAGFDFAGWTSSDNSTPNKNVTISKGSTGNRTYTANWTANNYTYEIVYKSSSGKELGTSTITKPFGTTNVKVDPKTFEGYTSPASKTVSWNTTEPQTIVFTYTPTEYTISYILDGGTVAKANPTKYTIESETITLNNPTKTGYTFKGWTGDNGSTAQTTVKIEQGSTGSKAYTANWTANNYTYNIVYKSSSGKELGTDTITKPFDTTNVKVDPKAFTGYTSPASKNVTWNTTESQTITFTYTPIQYTITYELDGGTVTTANPNKYTIESEAFSLNSPSKTGFTFGGWYTTSGFSGDPVIQISKGSYGNKTLYAKWETDVFSITYNLNGGNLITANPVTYSILTETFTLKNPTKAGYTFTGWTGSNGSTPSTSVSILQGSTGNKEFTANWTENTYTVVYNANGGTGTMTPSSHIYSTAKALTANTFTRTGYTFKGWATSETGGVAYADKVSVSKLTAEANGTVNLYAVWEANSYKYDIVYKSSSGKELGTSTITKPFGTTNVKVDPKAFTGYTSPASQSVTWNETSKTITFTYTPIQYTITYKLDGGTVSKENPTKYTIETDTFILNNPTKTGYTFKGWTGTNVTTANTSVSIAKGSTGNKEFTANWTANTYTVKYNANGGTGTMTASNHIYGTASTLTANTFTRTGYTFKGWATSETGGVTYADKASVSKLTAEANGTVNLYAVWEANSYKYDIVYKSSSGKELGTDTITKPFSTTNVKVDPKAFTGYTSPASQNVTWDATSKTITFTYTPIQYTITYELNGGTVSTANPTKYTIETAFTLNNPTKEGYTFTGWTGSNGTTASTSVSIAKGSTGNKTYTANWKAIPTLRSWTYDSTDDFHSEDYRTKITTAEIVDSATVPANVAAGPWDVSETGNNSVQAWLVKTVEDDASTTTDETEYHLTIAGNSYGKIFTNVDSSYAFYNMTELTTFEGLNLLDTSNTTNMEGMFEYCEQVVTLDVSKWNVSKVENMSYTFYSCESLTTLDVSKWVTTNVNNLEYTFAWCEQLPTLNVSGWTTSNVTNLYYTFAGCHELDTLDVSKWNTAKVEDMGGTFYDCWDLTSLNLKGWDVSKVKYMDLMFGTDLGSSLTTIGDISQWNTSNVESMSMMFYDCSYLLSVDVSKWNTGNVTDMGSMFSGCSSLTSLNVSDWNTAKVEDMSEMFRGCSKLSSIDISKWNCSSLDYTTYSGGNKGMFQYCDELTELTIPASMSQVSASFARYCEKLVTITFKHTASDPLTLASAGSSGPFRVSDPYSSTNVLVTTVVTNNDTIQAVVDAHKWANEYRSTGEYSIAYNLNGGTQKIASVDYTTTSDGYKNFDGATFENLGNESLDMGSNFTYVAKFDGGVNTSGRIIGNWESGGGGIYNSGGYIQGEFYIGGSWISVKDTEAISADKTYWAAVTYDGTAVKLYVNGKYKGETPASGDIVVSKAPIAVGINPNTSGGGSGYLTGKVYKAAAYNYTLSAKDIEELYKTDNLSPSVLNGSYNILTETFSLPTPTKTGYIFEGWYETADFSTAKVTQIPKGSTGNKTFYAKWTLKTITVTFHKNDGSGSKVTQTFTYGESGNKFGYNTNGTPKWEQTGQFGQWDREGYDLLGWAITSTATAKNWTIYSSVTDNWINTNYPSIDLYAVWEMSVLTLNDISYTGTMEKIDDGDGNWRIKFLDNGTLTINKTGYIDAFLVGGGAGANFYAGGGGGYTRTQNNIYVTEGSQYTITIGAGGVGGNESTTAHGGSTSAFGFTAAGGYCGSKAHAYGAGGNGGSGGGAANEGSGTLYAGAGGINGQGGGSANGTSGGQGQIYRPGPNGEKGITKEFSEETGSLYATGGGGYGATATSTDANTGNGGNAGWGAKTGCSGVVVIRNARNPIKVDGLRYTGMCKFIDDGNGNWRIKFLTSGTLTVDNSINIDAFLVGGGAGANFYAGGGGGYTRTEKNINLTEGSYTITIGAGGIGSYETTTAHGGSTSAFGYTAAGGYCGSKAYSYGAGGNGGSGGGAADDGDMSAGAGGTNGNNGGGATSASGGKGQKVSPGPNGETGNTREFGEETGTLYASGGGGYRATATSKDDNTGNGGNAGWGAEAGCSGIVVIRNIRSTSTSSTLSLRAESSEDNTVYWQSVVNQMFDGETEVTLDNSITEMPMDVIDAVSSMDSPVTFSWNEQDFVITQETINDFEYVPGELVPISELVESYAVATENSEPEVINTSTKSSSEKEEDNNESGFSLFRMFRGLARNIANGWNLGDDPTVGVTTISDYAGENTTAVARITGSLYQLFSSDNDVEYKGYRVVVTDKNGVEYESYVNREGKYTLSNIPPKPSEKLTARVYTPEGKEVTEYGGIYAILADDAWNNSMTVTLQLEEGYIAPIKNNKIYEEEDCTFIVEYPANKLPDNITWYYHDNDTTRWKSITDLQAKGLKISTTKPVIVNGDTVRATMTLSDVPIEYTGTNFKAVITINGEKKDTFDSRKEGYAGLLLVEERPWTIYPITDQEIWQGDDFSFTAQLTHYKGFTTDGTGLVARWQYNTGTDAGWYDLESSAFFEDVEIINKSTKDPLIEGDIHNLSTLKVKNARAVIDGFKFRCVFDYEKMDRQYYTSDVASEGYEGKISVEPLTIKCIESPERIELVTNGANGEGEYKFTAKFKYTSQDGEVDIDWLFKPNQEGKWNSISESPYYSNMRVETSEPVVADEEQFTYVVTTTLIITDPPIGMDSDNIHYYFKAKATNKNTSATSGTADILFRYTIDIVPNEPKISPSGTSDPNIYTYPDLEVYAIHGLTEFTVQFTDTTGSDTMTNSMAFSGITALENGKGFTYSGAKVTTTQVQNWLRNMQFSITSEEVEIEWTITDGTQLSENATQYGNKMYEIITVPLKEDAAVSYQEAEEIAKAMGQEYGTDVTLATIETEEENKFLSKLLQESGADIAWIGDTVDNENKKLLWSNESTSYSAKTENIDYSAYDKLQIVFRAYPDLVTKDFNPKGNEEFYLMIDIDDTDIKTAMFDFSDSKYIERTVQLVSGGVQFGNGKLGKAENSSVAVPFRIYGITSDNLTVNNTKLREVLYNPYNSNALANMNSLGITALAEPSFPHGTKYSEEDVHRYKFVSNGTSSITFTNARKKALVLRNEELGEYGYLAHLTSKEEQSAAAPYLSSGGYIGALLRSNSCEWYWVDGPVSETSTPFARQHHYGSGCSGCANETLWGYFPSKSAGKYATSGNRIFLVAGNNVWDEDNEFDASGYHVEWNSDISMMHTFIVEYQAFDDGYVHAEKTAKATDIAYGPGKTSSGTEVPTPSVTTTEYRTNTDVIISCEITSLTDINPDNPASVTFTITNVDGTKETKVFDDVCLPTGRSQRAYVRHNTGPDEGQITVDISVSGKIYNDVSKITATVSKIVENPPADPKGTDTRPDDFDLVLPAVDTSETTHSWTTYTCESDGTEWTYTEIDNTAYLRTIVSTTPDEKVPTAIGKTMKSGYGINTLVTAQIVSESSAYELPQTVISFFPEFEYENYWRILRSTDNNSFAATFEFANNEYSMEDRRVHFTPVWFPDGDYKVLVTVRDAWTPVGELKGSYVDGQPIQIDGSLYDDWYAKENQ